MKEHDNNPSEEGLLKVLEQNCLHARHIESIRLWFTNIYVIVVAATFGMIGGGRIEEFTFLPIFLLVFSLAGIIVTYNLTGAFKNHVTKARLIAKRLNLSEYLALGVLFEKGGKWKYLMHPWEFYILYFLVIGICFYILIIF